MDNEVVIKAVNLSKIYYLYENNKDRVKEVFNPFGKKYSRCFYALNNVSFEIKKGEMVGIIGKNGAGKSTLLKIITGVLNQTSGTIEVKGNISALLELGAGFNPDMTGMENIFLMGALMGFSKEEMTNKVEAILKFADIGEFINQPVKTYSSGMMVRLAFAVQTQVNPDILIVDEALAVGDALFQKRCFQRINELVADGTTILFVSHDQELIRTMTNRAIFLVNGEIVEQGLSSDVILSYRKFLHNEERRYWEEISQQYNQKVKNNEILDGNSYGDMDAQIVDVKVFNEKMEEQNLFYPKEKIIIKASIKINKRLEHLNIGLRIRNKEGIKIYSWGTLNQDIDIWARFNGKAGNVFWDKVFMPDEIVNVLFESKCMLGQNLYEIQVIVSEEKDRYYGAQRILHWKDEAAFFTVNIARQEYFFGGVCDLKMKAVIEN
jgi:lipopolysaccharide transport system ATP-binding protein